MTSKARRALGIGMIAIAAILAVLSLKRTANLGMNSTATIFLILGIVLIRRAKGAQQNQS
jgi:hypothetical protein